MNPRTGNGKFLVVISVLALFVVGVVSCARTTKEPPTSMPPTQVQLASPTPPEGKPQEPVATIVPTATTGPTAVPTPKVVKPVVIVIAEDPPSFNAIVGDTGFDGLVMNMVLLGLTGVDPQGNVYPELATELPTMDNGGVLVDEEAGTMVVTWTLRQDVFWSDGTPVTADDVVFTWEAIMNPETGIWVRGSDYVESIEKIDDSTAAFHYSSIYPGYLTQLGGEQLVVWPAHYCSAEQGFVAWD